MSDLASTNKPPKDASSSIDELSKTIIDQMQGIFGKHPGYRTTHAKGLLVEGTFTPSSQAKTLSLAPHFNSAATPIIARFSIGGGIPHLPDADPNAGLKGFAIRFLIDDDTHSDLIAHTYPGFPTTTGEEFSQLLQHLAAMGAAESQLNKVKQGGGDSTKEDAALKSAQGDFSTFLGSHKAAAAFVQTPPSNPHNFGTIAYYSVNTHVLTNADGKTANVRYRLDPVEDQRYTEENEIKQLAPNYLEDDLKQRFPQKPIVFTLQAHVADPDDVLDDATVPYKSKTFIPVGKIELNKLTEDNAAKQQEIAFSPRPEKGGVEGMTASTDPLIKVRQEVYYISRDQRRAEKQVE